MIYDLQYVLKGYEKYFFLNLTWCITFMRRQGKALLKTEVLEKSRITFILFHSIIVEKIFLKLIYFHDIHVLKTFNQAKRLF